MTMTSFLYTSVTESTMDDARNAVRNGHGHGTVCWTDHQRLGRGRLPGRQWFDNGDGSLLFTLVLEKKSVSAGFPPTQIAALALCLRLEQQYGLKPCIKWPNDVLVSSRKIAGILVESEGSFWLLGAGINMGQTRFPQHLEDRATSVLLECPAAGPTVGMRDRAAEISSLAGTIQALSQQTIPAHELEKRLDSLGETVTVSLGDPSRNETMTGTVSGLNSDGSLLITQENGRSAPVYSGEILKKKS